MTEHRKGKSWWLLLDGRRVNIVSRATTNLRAVFTLDPEFDPYAYILYFTDKDEYYTVLRFDGKVGSQRQITVGHSCWEPHKNTVDPLYASDSLLETSKSLPSDIDRTKLLASVGRYGYTGAQLKELCLKYKVSISGKAAKDVLAAL